MDTKNVDGTVEGSTLSEAGLRNVTLRDVCLSGADLRGSDLTPEALLLVGAEFDETTTF